MNFPFSQVILRQIMNKKKQQQTRQSTDRVRDNLEHVTDKMKKKFCIKQFFFLFYHIARIALCIAIIVVISETDMIKLKKNSQYVRVQQILSLWGKDVITDIITVSTYNCPKGYEQYTSAEWEGTNEGCLCQARLNQYDYIHVIPGQCSLALIGVGCTKIAPQKPIKFAFWKPNYLICLKRIRKLNFYANLSNFVKVNNIKTCSNGANYEIQSLEIEPCPITAISNLSGTYPHKLQDIQFSYARQTGYPIIDIKMTQYQFCLQYNRSNISPNRFQNYDLQILQKSNCKLDRDPRVKEIDQITEKQLFQNNQRIYDIITNDLPIYPIPTDRYVYKLGTVQYPPWTKQCRFSDQYNLKNAKPIFEYNQGIEKSQTCMYLAFAMVSIWGFLFSLLSLIKRIIEIRSKYKNGIIFYPNSEVQRINPNLLSNTIQLSLFCQCIIFFFLLFLALGLLIQIGVQYKYTSNTEQWLRNSFKCMDTAQYFKQWVQKGYLYDLQLAIRNYVICLLCTIVVISIDFVFLVWRLNKGDLQNQNVRDLFPDQNIQQNQNIQNSNHQDEIMEQKQFNDPNLSDGDQNQHKSKHSRQKTMDVDVNTHRHEQATQNQYQSNIRRSKKRYNPMNRRNTIGMPTMAINEVRNPTEESLVNMDDDLQLHKITLEESPRKKNRKVTDKKKNAGRSRILSLDMEDDD